MYGQKEDLGILLENMQESYANYYQRKRILGLTFFDYAIKHIMRISRLLKLKRGNGVLLGIPGTGR